MTAPCHPEDGANPSAVGIAWVAHVCRPRGTVVAGPSLRNRGHPRPRGIPAMHYAEVMRRLTADTTGTWLRSAERPGWHGDPSGAPEWCTGRAVG
jgi:hypothetical protein